MNLTALHQLDSVQRKLAGQPCSLFHAIKRRVQCAFEWSLDKSSMLRQTRWTSPEFTAARSTFCVELIAAASAAEVTPALVLLSPQNVIVEGQLALTAVVSGDPPAASHADLAQRGDPTMISLCRCDLAKFRCKYDMDRASMPFAPSVPRSVLLAVADHARIVLNLSLVVAFKHFTPEKSLVIPIPLGAGLTKSAPDLSMLLSPATPLADVTLICQGEQAVPAHRVLLAARSRVWADEKQQPSVIRLPEFDRAIVMHLLHFVYTGTVAAGGLTSAEHALDLLRLACRFRLEQLALLCVRAFGLHVRQQHLSQAVDCWVACRRSGLLDASVHLATIVHEFVSCHLTETQAARLLAETESLHAAELRAECKGKKKKNYLFRPCCSTAKRYRFSSDSLTLSRRNQVVAAVQLSARVPIDLVRHDAGDVYDQVPFADERAIRLESRSVCGDAGSNAQKRRVYGGQRYLACHANGIDPDASFLLFFLFVGLLRPRRLVSGAVSIRLAQGAYRHVVDGAVLASAFESHQASPAGGHLLHPFRRHRSSD